MWGLVSKVCDQSCGGQTLHFPFGFSSGCHIQLNCTSIGTILAGDFTVQSVTTDSISVYLPATCGRPLESLGGLFTQNYAPLSQNAILLENCSTLSSVSVCAIPRTIMLGCSYANGNDSISCYSETKDRDFLDYKNLTSGGRRTLFSSVVTDRFENNSVSLDFQIVRMGWWLLDEPQCPKNAKLLLSRRRLKESLRGSVVSPLKGSPAMVSWLGWAAGEERRQT